MAGDRCSAMRLLPGGPDDVRRGVAREDPQAKRSGDRRRNEWESLPVWNLSADPAGNSPGCRNRVQGTGPTGSIGAGREIRRLAMKTMSINRRSFLRVTSLA